MKFDQEKMKVISQMVIAVSIAYLAFRFDDLIDMLSAIANNR